MREVRVETGRGRFGQRIEIGPHVLPADEPVADGGDDTGPAPHEFLLAALGTCTAMTLQGYAQRKDWRLARVEVHLSGKTEPGGFRIRRAITLAGELTPEQRTRLLEIANKCPVHRTLSGPIHVETRLD